MTTASLTALSDAHPEGYRQIPPHGVRDRLAQFRVIDVREPDEFVGPLSHIQGAELVPLATVETAARTWPRDQALLMVCRSGARSGRACAALTRMGFTQVYNLIGGMLVWNEHQLPTARAGV